MFGPVTLPQYFVSLTEGGGAQASAPIPIILDTDIGDDVDDAYALVLAARWKAVELVAVTCVWGPTLSRARLARKLLDICEHHHVPVFPADDKQGHNPQLDWAEGYEFQAPVETAAQAIVRLANERLGELTLVPIGALSNVGKALDLDPQLGKKLRRIVLMGGWLDPSQHPERTPVEYNIGCDPEAGRKVFQSGANIVMVGLDVTLKVRLEREWMERMASAEKPWTHSLVELTACWGHGVPTLHDPLALSCVERDSCTLEPRRIEVDATGRTIPTQGPPNALAAIEVDAPSFLDWYVNTVSQ
jgi:purine nucleosidase